MSNKRILPFLLRLCIGIGLITILLFFVDLPEMVKILSKADLRYLILLILLASLDRLLMAYKWNILLKEKQLDISLGDVIKVYYIGSFWGLVLPTGVGGDVLRSYLIGRKNQKTVEVVSSIFIERLFGIVVSAILALISVLVLIDILKLDFWNIFLWLILGFFGFCLLVFISFNESLLKWIINGTSKFSQNSFIVKLKKLYISYQSYRQNKKVLIRFSLWTLIEQIIPIIVAYFTAIALNIKIPFIYFVAIIPIALILSRIPISVEGVGIQEGVYVYFFTLIGVDATQAFLIALIGHFVVLVALIPGAFMYYGRRSTAQFRIERESVVGEFQ